MYGRQGSQASFITEGVQCLGLALRHSNVPVFGIGETEPVHPKGIVSCFITPKGRQTFCHCGKWINYVHFDSENAKCTIILDRMVTFEKFKFS